MDRSPNTNVLLIPADSPAGKCRGRGKPRASTFLAVYNGGNWRQKLTGHARGAAQAGADGRRVSDEAKLVKRE